VHPQDGDREGDGARRGERARQPNARRACGHGLL
jgi:hypothetical protein